MSSRWYLRQVLSVCVTFIFRLHLLLTTRALAQDATCEVASVEPLASTSVTCHFPEDVSQTNKGFSIVMYKGNRSQDEKDIVECWWLEGKVGCAVSSGYKYNRMVSNQLTLDIPQVSAEHIGSYACKLVNMDHNRIKPCELKIKLVGKTMCDVSSAEHGSQTSLTCYFPEDVSKTKKDLAVYHYASDGHRDRVLHVGWLGDRVNCISDRRYQFDCSFSNHLTLTIPRASTDEEEMYSCDIAGMGTDRSENCLFNLKKDAVNSSCSIPSVQEEQPTTLTCTFSVDINVTRRDFTVVRLGDKTNNSVGILVCTWRNNQLKFTTGAGYEFNNIVTDHLVISVPRASRDYNATYACHVIGSDMKGFESCDFVAMQVGSAVNISYSASVDVIVVIILSFLFLVVFILFLLVVLKLKGLQWKDMIPYKCVKRKASKSTEVRVTKVVLTLSPQETIQLLKTGSHFSVDSLKQTTGVEVFYDDRPRRKVRKNISIRGTLPQVRRSLQIIDETLDNTSPDVLNQEKCSLPQTSLTSQAICTQVVTD